MKQWQLALLAMVGAALAGCATPKSALQSAWEQGNDGLMEQELANAKNNDFYNPVTGGMLYNATNSGQFNFARFLIEQGADFTTSPTLSFNSLAGPNCDVGFGATPFSCTITYDPHLLDADPSLRSQQLALIESMLDRVDNIDDLNIRVWDWEYNDQRPHRQRGEMVWSPMEFAASKLDFQVMDLLLERGADPKWIGSHSALAQLVQLHHHNPTQVEQGIAKLLDAGVDLNDVADSLGNTALTYAMKAGNEDLANKLIQKGANPQAANKFGQTPYYFLAEYKREQRARASGDNDALFDALTNVALGYSVGKIAGMDSADALNLGTELAKDPTGASLTTKAQAATETSQPTTNRNAQASGLAVAPSQLKPDYFKTQGQAQLAECDEKDWGDEQASMHCMGAMQYYISYMAAFTRDDVSASDSEQFYQNHTKAAQLALQVLRTLQGH